MVILSGKGVSTGVAIGRLSFFRHGHEPLTERCIHPDEIQIEIERFHKACDIADKQILSLYKHALSEVAQEDAQIFQIHRTLIRDPSYVESVETIIREECLTAANAVERTSEKYAAIFLALESVRMQERAADVEDVSNRIISILSGTDPSLVDEETPVIIAADDLAPSETIQLDRRKILGFVTRQGSGTSHTAILASTMGIPAVIGVGEGIGPVDDGKTAAVDGEVGRIYIEPDSDTLLRLRRKRDRLLRQQGELQKYKGLPSVTRGGQHVALLANIAVASDVEAAVEEDAEGVGLLRSEFLYLERSGCPTQEEQFRAYRTILRRMQGKRVVIRTLDLGADKRADYLNMPHEENPALGCRGVRLCLKRPELFRTQLRAIYRASAFGKVAVLLPMISSVNEVYKAQALIEEVRGELERQNIPFDSGIELGVMIETPAAALISDRLAQEVDFFSIGTNDLTQYTLAVDRQSAAPGAPFDEYHPAVLALIERTVHNAHQYGIPVCICGELAGDPLMTQTFLSYGVDELSVSPTRILSLRRTVRDLD